jgi:hypothetical protein
LDEEKSKHAKTGLGAEQNGFGPTFLHSLQRLVKKGIATKSLPAAEVRERVYILTNML